ncbi:MAG: hypothetical protein NWQ02_04235 [Flavobacteriaceae bacterium]|jgi:hypothetical protein|nr:hypothetical protein [Flavobacteriaceae bacterium]
MSYSSYLGNGIPRVIGAPGMFSVTPACKLLNGDGFEQEKNKGYKK